MARGSLEKRIARIETLTTNEHLLARALWDLVNRAIQQDETLLPAQSETIRDARNRLLQVSQDQSHPLYMDVLLELAAMVLNEGEPCADTDAVFDESVSAVVASWNTP